MAQILEFPGKEVVEVRREKQFVQEQIEKLSEEARGLAGSITSWEEEAIEAATRYYQITTEVMFLMDRLQRVHLVLAGQGQLTPYPFPIIQMELPYVY